MDIFLDSYMNNLKLKNKRLNIKRFKRLLITYVTLRDAQAKIILVSPLEMSQT